MSTHTFRIPSMTLEAAELGFTLSTLTRLLSVLTEQAFLVDPTARHWTPSDCEKIDGALRRTWCELPHLCSLITRYTSFILAKSYPETSFKPAKVGYVYVMEESGDDPAPIALAEQIQALCTELATSRENIEQTLLNLDTALAQLSYACAVRAAALDALQQRIMTEG